MGKVNTYITAADGQRIEFTLDRGRRRTAALAINEGRLTVRVPERSSADDIRKFIEGHL